MPLRLYRARFSTNVERVALTLALKGLTAESVWITYDDRSVVQRVSGQPLVPVLDYDGEILVESMDIVRELDRRHPQPPLYAEREGEVLAFVDWFNYTWKEAPNRIEDEMRREDSDTPLIAGLGRLMLGYLDRFEDMLTGRDYLVTSQLSAADICAFPFVKYATLDDAEDTELFHKILKERQRDGKPRPRLAAWIDRINALPRA